MQLVVSSWFRSGGSHIGSHASHELLFANFAITIGVEISENTSPHLLRCISMGLLRVAGTAFNIENSLETFRSDFVACIGQYDKCHFQILSRQLDLLVSACCDEL